MVVLFFIIAFIAGVGVGIFTTSDKPDSLTTLYKHSYRVASKGMSKGKTDAITFYFTKEYFDFENEKIGEANEE